MEQMGSSMRNSVFTEDVVKGLKRWRGRARKNLALLKNTNSREGPLSIDHSLDTSTVGTSPSFGTLDISVSLDADSVAVEIIEEEEEEKDHQQVSQHRAQKISSFNGFH